MAYYVDTSAWTKLVVAEHETMALMGWITTSTPVLITSDLARTELLRAVRRVAPEVTHRAQLVLNALIIMRLDTRLFEFAARLDPVILRSLDALHIAAALELGDDLEGLIAYDDRLITAAQANGIQTVTPR